MTKEEKRVLLWRLKEAPDAASIAKLVEQKVVSAEEARKLVFTEVTEEKSNKKVAALEEEIKFLRETVDKLASRVSSSYPIVYEIYKTYHPSYWDWYRRYQSVFTSDNTGSLLNNRTVCLSSLNSASGTVQVGASTAANYVS